MALVRDFLMLRWPYAQEVTLAAFAFFHSARVKKIEKDGGRRLFWAESLVMTYMMAFGGGIIAPFLLGKPPVMFVNDLVVPLVALAWFLSNKAEGAVFSLLQTPLAKQIILVLAECFRANSACGMVMTATSVLKASKYYPIPLWGPVLMGTLAGCGGLFLPLDKGLAGIKNGAPWPMQSAFYGAFFFHLMVNDPNVGPYLRDAASYIMEGEPVPVARALVTAFFCVSAIAQTILGASFNPLSPVHSVLYTVTGVPTAGEVQDDSASQSSEEDKPKED